MYVDMFVNIILLQNQVTLPLFRLFFESGKLFLEYFQRQFSSKAILTMLMHTYLVRLDHVKALNVELCPIECVVKFNNAFLYLNMPSMVLCKEI